MGLGMFVMRVFVVGAVLLAISACGPKNFTNDNDALRRERLELTRELAKTRTALQNREQHIAALRARLDQPSGSSATAPASTQPAGTQPSFELPRLSSIRFSTLSGPLDTDADGSPDVLRLYVQTLDADGRFLLTAAAATAQAIRLEPGDQPAIVASEGLEPAAFHAAYRDGLLGTHYTLVVPLPKPLPAELDEVLVKVTLTPPSGERFEITRVFSLRPILDEALR